MKLENMSLKAKLILYIVIGTLAVLLISTAMTISTVTTQEENLAYKQATEMAKNYASEFNGDMEKNMAIAETIAVSMSSYDSLSREETSNMLYDLLVEHPDLLGTYVAYEPNAFDGEDELYVNSSGHDATGRFVPYWNKIGGDIQLNPLVNYDKLDYYQLPKETKRTAITQPYYYEGVFMVSFVSPIMKDNEFQGISGVDVSLNYLNDEISTVKAFDTGYAFMVDDRGVLVAYPYNKELIGEKTLYDFGIEELSTVSEDILSGNSGHVETIDPTTGEDVVMFYEPVTTGNFSFILVIPKDEIFAGVQNLSNKLLLISLAAVLFMGGFSYLIALSFNKTITDIVHDFKTISKDAVKGNLSTRAETNVEKDFKEIPIGLNEILEAVVTPVRDTIRLTKSLSRGKLSDRSKLEAKGEFKQLANTLDTLAESLDTMIEDSNRVLTAFQHNDFSQKIEVHGEGDFGKLTEGIEKTRITLAQIMDERKKLEEVRKKEIHHRIKNNLQVISSLLDLESEKFDDDAVIEAFRESQNRVVSMALVHEELYKSQDMESIDFSDYLMKLVNELSYSYMMEKENIKVKLDLDIVFIDMETAIPLGMIVNEIISNSLKHAFAPEEEGEIFVYLDLTNGKLTLTVGDNGRGFPEGMDFTQTESLGLQLVTTLTAQINGTIELDRNKGTKFKIRLK
ncbi:histidine kinase dimerization/phosphoacceptor domain -containing protein [Methanolobus profundi]|uniref:histidine kinase n=1 Tax=Methanolobus profundi TaxID=487685 RepID=A0A1I4T3R6_9EURY|nr:histidine kinase dimerization/phosphoacceptor domain -containing protein [Methanolobus profundi]SFM71281.1 Two-component sensor histidine kinase, contains HisKA and HATPase domains [Methanolobus profundi]